MNRSRARDGAIDAVMSAGYANDDCAVMCGGYGVDCGCDCACVAVAAAAVAGDGVASV